MNKWLGIGRLTRDPETRYTQGDNPMAISRYTLAVDRYVKNGEQITDFISCIAFGSQGEFAEKYLSKGMKIGVEGKIQTGSYEKDGHKVYTTDVAVEKHFFCESRNNSNTTAPAQTNNDGFINIPDEIEEELPFN